MKKILVVDDSGIIRLSVCGILRNAGYQVFEAVNGNQVVNDYFDPQHSLKDMDLILLDLHLEDVFGINVFKVIVSRYPNIPVVVISGEKKREIILQCIELGAKDYLVKPISEEDLLLRVGRLVPLEKEEETAAERQRREIQGLIASEVERAIRSDTCLAFLHFDFKRGQAQLEKMLSAAAGKLRSIDYVLQSPAGIAVILPTTDSDGAKQVRDKLMVLWKEKDLLERKPDVKAVVFPTDFEQDWELLLKMKRTRIRDAILRRLGIRFLP